MNNGLPVELLDVVDERTVYAGSYQALVEMLEQVGLEHVKNARFVFDDIDSGKDRVVLWYMKDAKEYDDFDLRQFGARLKRLEASVEELEHAFKRTEDSLESKLEAARTGEAIPAASKDIGLEHEL